MTQKVQTLTIAHLKEKKVLLVRGKAYNIKTSNTIYHKAKFEMDEERHIELLKLLTEFKGKVVLSGYKSDLYEL